APAHSNSTVAGSGTGWNRRARALPLFRITLNEPPPSGLLMAKFPALMGKFVEPKLLNPPEDRRNSQVYDWVLLKLATFPADPAAFDPMTLMAIEAGRASGVPELFGRRSRAQPLGPPAVPVALLMLN